jgi:hypothetical protein
VPNLLDTLRSRPTSVASSPTSEFPPPPPPGYFSTLAAALENGDLDRRVQSPRKKLTQPLSLATDPPVPPERKIYGHGAGPPHPPRRRGTITEALFAGAQWKVEPQQFGVNGGLINAVRSAYEAHQLGDYTWVGTLGMVFPSERSTDF